MLDIKTAKRRLTNRWLEQCEKYPLMRKEIPLALYVVRNIQIVRENEQLAEYDRA